LTLYHSLLRPLLFRLPPETAHEIALHSLASAPAIAKLLVERQDSKIFGNLKRFGLEFPNPVGLAAGFDKDGVALRGLAALGFGFIEAGTVTFHPQLGNPRPRLFRLSEDNALINRAGFNNAGAAAFVDRVARNRPPCVLGVSIGKSKIVPMENAIEDYTRCFELVYPVADYIAVNVSSPNTPRLRELQQRESLDALLRALVARRRQLASEHGVERPLLVKVSPDLDQQQLEEIVRVVEANGIAGIIATNTSITRDGLKTSKEKVLRCGDGGLSGAPIRHKATSLIAQLYRLTSGRTPIVGVGGIFNARDAWEKICAGASLIQLYTGFIYEGPSIARDICKGLHEILLSKGFGSLDDAVGSRVQEFRQDG